MIAIGLEYNINDCRKHSSPTPLRQRISRKH